MQPRGALRRSETCCPAPSMVLRIWTHRAGRVGVGAFMAWSLLAAAAWSTEEQPAADAGCPLRLDQRSVGLPRTCLFVGRYNGSCGGQALAIFAGDGETVVVGLAFGQTGPTTYFAGDVVSDTEGSLVIWQHSLEMLAASEVSGRLSLTHDGRELRVELAGAPFQVAGCQFGGYVGHFVEMVDAVDALPGAPRPTWESAATDRPPR